MRQDFLQAPLSYLRGPGGPVVARFAPVRGLLEGKRCAVGDLPEPQRLDDARVFSSPELRFESRFESGNLRAASRVGEFEYDLVLDDDTNTRGNNQWYLFSIAGNVRGTYRFNILNLGKSKSLYSLGMQPCVWSKE